MNECFNKWATDLSSLSDLEFEEFLDHAEICQFHSAVLERYESAAMPLIKMAFSDIPAQADHPVSAYIGVSASSETRFYNYKGTSFGSAPNMPTHKGRSIEEEMISAKTKEIFKTGFTAENCQKALKYLERNDTIVRNSWSNTLNKAKILTAFGEKKEAEKILRFVMEKYSESHEAVGIVYEVLAWFEELKYNEGGKVDRQMLDRRMEFINKGLKFYPQHFMLWINAFEVACLKNSVDAAISYLKKLEKMDNKIARQYLIDSPIKKEISQLPNRLKKEIIRLSPKIKMEIS